LSNSIDLMMIKLESQMFNKLCESCAAGAAAGNANGISFSDVLNNAIGDTASCTADVAGTFDSGEPRDAGEMTVSDNMVKFIEEHEGFASTPYCGIDYWNQTVGYGHVITDGEIIGPLTQESAETLLRNDLKTYEESVNKEFKGVKLTQAQFDSLVSFAYNLGANIWSSTPKLVADIKNGAPADVIKSDFENCDHCGGVAVQGLLNRRNDEWKVYAYGDYT
jgi:lysozyme